MTFMTKCPTCGRLYSNIPQKYLGKTTRCQQCHTRFHAESITAAAQPQPMPSAEMTTQADETAGQQSGHAATSLPTVWDTGDRILNIYDVKQVHKSGGMGVVYRVHHRHWNVDLAVKHPRLEYFSTEQQKENFTRECEAWIHLGLHPHIVSCFYVRRVGDVPCVFAEYIEGGTLEEWIANETVYQGTPQETLERILDIAIQFAWGIRVAHEKGLIHQDVKPLNVMMKPDGTAKVTDFGLANARQIVEEGSIEGPGQQITASFRGKTLPYCSPEQADIAAKRDAGIPRAHWPKLSPQTDIWSWAVSILHLLTKSVSWTSGSIAGEFFESSLDMADDIFAVPLPQRLSDLLRWCFKAAPEERPPNMGTVAAALQEIYTRHTGQPYPRKEPKTAELLADSLNNRAVSLLDLGRTQEAKRLWDKALEKQAHHPEATFNLGMFLWRIGRLTDDMLIKQMEEVSRSHQERPEVEYLSGLIHAERGDYETTRAIFDNLPEEIIAQENLQEVQTLVNTYLPHSRRRVWTGRQRKNTPEHSEEIAAGALAPNGRAAVTSVTVSSINPADPLQKRLFYNMLEVWNVTTGELQHTISTPLAPRSTAISGRGRYAVTGDDNGTLTLWDIAAKQSIRAFQGHSGAIVSLCFSKDGRKLLSGSRDCTLKLWDLTNGSCLQTFTGHAREVNAGVLSNDERYALSGAGGSEVAVKAAPDASVRFERDTRGADNTARLWELKSGKCLRTFEGHTDIVSAVALSHNLRYTLTGSYDRTLKLWENKSGRCIGTFHGHIGNVTAVSISPDTRYALSGSADGTIRLWEMKSGRCLWTFKEFPVHSLSLSKDWRQALSISRKSLSLWNIGYLMPAFSAPAQICHVRTSETALSARQQFDTQLAAAREAFEQHHYSQAAAYLRQARAIEGYARESSAVELWQTLYGRLSRQKLQGAWKSLVFDGHAAAVSSAAFTPDSGCVLSAGHDRVLKLWAIASGNCLRTYTGHADAVTALSITQDGRLAVSSGGFDGSCRIWNLDTGECLSTFSGHKYVISAAALHCDGRYAVSGDVRGTILLWEAASGSLIRTFDTDFLGMLEVTSLRFSQAGQCILAASENGSISLWNAETGDLLLICEGHTGAVLDAALCDDPRYALSGSRDQTVKYWDLQTGNCLRTFQGHTAPVSSVSFSSDTGCALSGSHDHTLKLWKLATGECVRTFEGHTEKILSAALSADGRYALAGSADTTISLWTLDWELGEDEAFAAPEPADGKSICPEPVDGQTQSLLPYHQQLIAELKKADWQEAMSLITKIRATSAKPMVPHLLECLNSRQPMAMAAAAQILADWNLTEYVPLIANALEQYPYGPEPGNDLKPGLLCDALLRLGDPQGAPAVWSAFKKGASRAVLMSAVDQRSFHERALELWENYGEQQHSTPVKQLVTLLLPPGKYVGLWGMKSLHDSTTERWAYVDIVYGTGVSFQSQNKRASRLEWLDKKVQTWNDYGTATFPAFWNTSRYKDRVQPPAFPNEADVFIGPLEILGFDAAAIMKATALTSQIYQVVSP